ncbi:MAG: hypothetical protein E2O74_05405 [Chloroflexi bacterium]|nr:MAG: hypothetical protein E2O74_05405 [Chloroflexota bacterium]
MTMRNFAICSSGAPRRWGFPCWNMYWSESVDDRIRRANLDGSGDVEIITGLGNVRGIALDP